MSDTDKRADEIIEETMKEIYEDLNKSENEKSEDMEAAPEDMVEESAPKDIGESDEESDKDFEDYFDADEEEEYEDKVEEDEDGQKPWDGFGARYDSGIISLDDEDDEVDADKEAKKKSRKKKAAIIAGSIIGIIAVVYIGFAVYFSSHFMFFTSINGNDFSLKSVAQVEEYMKQQVADYALTLEESDGDSEQIAGTDISLEYVPGDEITKLVTKQNNFLWIKSLWEKPEIEAKVGVKYDETKLAQKIAALQCLVPENQTASIDAHPEFKDTGFVVVPEVVGTQIDMEKFNTKVAEAIGGFLPTLNLTEAGVYIQPRFVEDSQEVIAAKDAMNSYLGANITYDFNPNTEVVDSSVISQWVRVDADMNVTFDEEAVRAYIASLAEKYDTKGKPRQFTTATGNAVTVEGGAYGWRISQDEEYAALTANIQNAETVTREPVYSSRAASHGAMDVGGTYAEVDLTNQHMYFIQDGQVVLDSPVVTGNPNRGNATPQGTYTLTYKTRNATLRGERKPDGTYSYETPVAYWMPFNGGIGFHDATWQSSFGGSRYKSHGSHGCVNMPKDKAAQLYELIPEACPVVCHY